MRRVVSVPGLVLGACALVACASDTDLNRLQPEASKEASFSTLAAIEEKAAADRQAKNDAAFEKLAAIEARAIAARDAKKPDYLGVQTRLLQADLVSILVEMRQPRGQSDISDYSACAAAQYALIRGFGFARHVRTNLVEEAGIWKADAVYTISPALPDGVKTLDAEVTVANCNENGIPTV